MPLSVRWWTREGESETSQTNPKKSGWRVFFFTANLRWSLFSIHRNVSFTYQTSRNEDIEMEEMRVLFFYWSMTQRPIQTNGKKKGATLKWHRLSLLTNTQHNDEATALVPPPTVKVFFVRECIVSHRVFLFPFSFFCLCCPATYPPSPSLLGRFVHPLFLLVFISVVAFSRATMSTPHNAASKKKARFVSPSCSLSCSRGCGVAQYEAR